MPLIVVPATEEDLPRSMAIERRAYGPNPTTPILFPGGGLSPETRAAQMLARKREDPACTWVKVVDADLEAKGEESMIAFSQWYVYSGDVKPSRAQRWWGLPGTNPEACEAFFGEMDRRWWDRFEGKSHVYLKLLHTDPDHQRRGAGGMLLKWGTAEADRLGLVSYLEASEEGRPLYEKYGFKEVGRIVVDLSKWGGTEPATAYLMLREPVLN
ncbi:acyl-CoA N-acyltransferase [Trichoderma citrinoviride]|uniref:Acyl-CoA N-acyltransferase n=1 Tax=Trichoderma citrinoviride TaxID=58853 RepID=A0A2T4B8E6_9HYPO|nr:acyl-CoA N-acyltransferase [Trichoderma citrinoviride]PTB65605.1 acyl-CoA N-acyltransferase [Trichoderma citrinoviride]